MIKVRRKTNGTLSREEISEEGLLGVEFIHEDKVITVRFCDRDGTVSITTMQGHLLVRPMSVNAITAAVSRDE